MEKIVLIGFGGHARSVADCITRMGKYDIAGYTDINKSDADNGYAYLGTDKELKAIFESGVENAVVTIGQIGTDVNRHKIYEQLKTIGFRLPIIADPSAIIAESAHISEGTFIGKGTIINSNASIGRMCIINTGALIEHDNKIGDFCHIAVRAVLSGMVSVGDNSFVGANATIIHGITLGREVVIGAGSTVIHNVNDNEVRYGLVRE